MEELLKFDTDMWDNILGMLSSHDGSTRNLAFGFLENIDYTNKDQMETFEDNMHLVMATTIPTEDKGKLVHHYFTALSKQNGNEYI